MVGKENGTVFESVSNDELFQIDGGFDIGSVVGGVLIVTTGVGCLAVACVPGVNVVAAACVAYAGSWGLAGGIALTTYGFVA